MAKITFEDLKKIKEQYRASTTLREGGARAKVSVHMGTCGIASGARPVLKALVREVEDRDIKDVIVTIAGCAGQCTQEPMATVEIKGEPPVVYGKLNEAKAKEIFAQHIVGGTVLEQYTVEERA